MRSISVVLIIAVVYAAYSDEPRYYHNTALYYNPKNAPELFNQFVKDYNKQYKDELDRQQHFETFVAKLNEYNKRNENSTNTVFLINEFSDVGSEGIDK